MSLRAIEFHVAEASTSIRRNALASFAAVTNCALSLAVLGVFILAAWNVSDKAMEIARGIRVVIHLRRDIDLQTTQALAEELLRRYPGCVAEQEVVSADEAWGRFKEKHPELIKDLESRPNPLGPQIVIRLQHPEDHAPVVHWAKQNPNVDEVIYEGQLLDALARFKRLGGWILAWVLALLTIASMLTISNTIGLTIHARRKEIGIMQMVGATARFIKTPFVMEGVFYGVVGAVIGSALLLSTYLEVAQLLEGSIPAIAPTVTSPVELAAVGGSLVVAGALFGSLGSYIAVQRYLSI